MKPWFSQEFDALFQQLYHSEVKTIALAGASHESGTSTVCRWLSERLSGENASVLLIDFDLSGRGQGYGKVSWSVDTTGYREAIISVNAFLSILPPPSDPAMMLTLRQPQKLTAFMDEWRQHYDYIVCDAGTVSATNWRNVSSSSIGAICDGTILVVGSAHTTESALTKSVHRLLKGSCSLIGIVMNDQHNPSLASEVIRVLDSRGSWIPESLRRPLRQWIKTNELLNGEYQR